MPLISGGDDVRNANGITVFFYNKFRNNFIIEIFLAQKKTKRVLHNALILCVYFEKYVEG